MKINKTYIAIDIFTIAVLHGLISAVDIYWVGIDLGFDHFLGFFPLSLIVLICHWSGKAFWWKGSLPKKAKYFIRGAIIVLVIVLSEVLIYKSELLLKASEKYGIEPADIVFSKMRRYDEVICLQIKKDMVFACFDKSNNFLVEKPYKFGSNGKPMYIDNTVPKVGG